MSVEGREGTMALPLQLLDGKGIQFNNEKIALFLQPNCVMGRMECKLAPQAHGTLPFFFYWPYFIHKT